jgi:hypothetical protein
MQFLSEHSKRHSPPKARTQLRGQSRTCGTVPNVRCYNCGMLTPEQLPEWWTQSAVFEFLNARGRHYWIGTWNHIWVAVIIWATTRQTNRIKPPLPSPRPRAGRATQVVHRSFQLTGKGSIRPLVLGWTVAVVQAIWFILTFSMLDRGYGFYHSSAMWGVVALTYTWFMWVWRIHLRRALAEPTPLPQPQPA